MPAHKQMTLRQREAHAKKQVEAWNQSHAVGTLVSFKELMSGGETHRSRTKSAATLMCGEAVVWIEAQGSCVCLDHCAVVAEEGH